MQTIISKQQLFPMISWATFFKHFFFKQCNFNWVAFHESSTLAFQFLLFGQFMETSTTKKSLPSLSVSKGITSLLWVRNDIHMNQKRSSCEDRDFPVIVRNGLSHWSDSAGQSPAGKAGLAPGAGIMEADDRQVTTVFTVQTSFHHRHSTNRVSWSVTSVGERRGDVRLHVRRR